MKISEISDLSIYSYLHRLPPGKKLLQVCLDRKNRTLQFNANQTPAENCHIVQSLRLTLRHSCCWLKVHIQSTEKLTCSKQINPGSHTPQDCKCHNSVQRLCRKPLQPQKKSLIEQRSMEFRNIANMIFLLSRLSRTRGWCKSTTTIHFSNPSCKTCVNLSEPGKHLMSAGPISIVNTHTQITCGAAMECFAKLPSLQQESPHPRRRAWPCPRANADSLATVALQNEVCSECSEGTANREYSSLPARRCGDWSSPHANQAGNF